MPDPIPMAVLRRLAIDRNWQGKGITRFIVVNDKDSLRKLDECLKNMLHEQSGLSQKWTQANASVTAVPKLIQVTDTPVDFSVPKGGAPKPLPKR